MIFTVVQTVLLGALVATFLRFHSASGSEGPLSVVGWLLLGSGFVLAVAAVAALGRMTRITPEPAPGGRLVERGVYRYLRHPMYTAAASASLGLGFVTPHPAVIGVAGAVIVFYLVKARYEERLLSARYPGYAAYKGRTWGVLPFLRRRGWRGDAW